ncbi:amino acid permease [Gammaproteobacteria bacterium]|jgi:APA family basic amino acid/polyamine antiporter|nr:amino acid permease [Gammaproteobacteria bacterium]MDA9297243.1 amino acid permease [Gammaproteobacteria bacterium]MDB4165213.1 amino acid permease [Gammaproteobacteria bacterium]MDC1511255.1 amino acid permease [Gammaproteobacteria bacterium]
MAADKFRFTTVTAVVVANMVGTGVFTSLGFQLLDIQSGFALLMLWAVGGLIAVCGAMTYAELGAALPRSGGEYNFLSRIYHPAAGFVSGWISSTIGFAGPTALAAMTFAAYMLSIFPEFGGPWTERFIAASLVIALSIVHATNRRNSGGLQLAFTILKVIIIIAFVIAAIVLVDTPQPVEFFPKNGDFGVLTSGEFAVSLIYVSYAFAGWNAATYLSSEMENPQRTLPGILLTGTVIVTLMYVALNFAFLYAAPMDSMAGEVEVGYIAAEAAFGTVGGRFTGIVLAMLLISTVSAMVMAGPRVIQMIGEDFPLLSVLGKTNAHGVPAIAIYAQGVITLVFIFSSTFESVLVFSGFTLAINNFATVSSIFVLRWRQPDLPRPYKTFLYPLPPLIFLGLTGWTLGFVMLNRPVEALFGLGIIASGLFFYWVSLRGSQIEH